MSSPSTTTKWMSYFAEGLLAEEEVQHSNPFFWCTNQQPVAEQVDCRYLCKHSPLCTRLVFPSSFLPISSFEGPPIVYVSEGMVPFARTSLELRQ